MAIEETLAHFKAQRVPMLWCTDPTSQPKDLEKLLEAHGLTGTSSPGMAADLQALNEDIATPSDFRIERVHDVETLKKWSHALCLGFGFPNFRDLWVEFEAGLGLSEDLPRLRYVGLLGKEPVATSGVFLNAGVAGIYDIATVPEARRRGIGAAITLAPLLEARAMGYRISIIHSSKVAFNVYRRLGFEEYCRMTYYKWPNGG